MTTKREVHDILNDDDDLITRARELRDSRQKLAATGLSYQQVDQLLVWFGVWCVWYAVGVSSDDVQVGVAAGVAAASDCEGCACVIDQPPAGE